MKEEDLEVREQLRLLQRAWRVDAVKEEDLEEQEELEEFDIWKDPDAIGLAACLVAVYMAGFVALLISTDTSLGMGFFIYFVLGFPILCLGFPLFGFAAMLLWACLHVIWYVQKRIRGREKVLSFHDPFNPPCLSSRLTILDATYDYSRSRPADLRESAGVRDLGSAAHS